mgnify:CR=1 FL=1
MATDEVKQVVATNRTRPGKQTEGVDNYLRSSRYKELVTYPMDLAGYAEEGSFYLAANATRGTGLGGQTAPTDLTLDTKALLYIQNTMTDANGDYLVLKYVRLQVTVAGTAGTNTSWADEIDVGATDRYTSGGTLLTVVGANTDLTQAATARIRFGILVTAAASASRRNLGSGVVRTAIAVVGDTYLFVYGKDTMPLSSMLVAGTAVANIVIPRPPVVLGPQDQYLLHFANASQTAAASYEVEIGYVQR